MVGDSELLGHPNQIGERFRAHLLHDVGAMKFNCSLGDGEFAGSLFVMLPSNNESRHFAFTRRELLITLAKFSSFRSRFVRLKIPLDGGEDSVQQSAIAKGFGKEFHRSRFHCARTDIGMSPCQVMKIIGI